MTQAPSNGGATIRRQTQGASNQGKIRLGCNDWRQDWLAPACCEIRPNATAHGTKNVMRHWTYRRMKIGMFLPRTHGLGARVLIQTEQVWSRTEEVV